MKDVFGLVPPQIKQMVEAEDYNDRQAKAGRAISEALTALNPYLDLIFVRHDAAPEMIPPGAVAGRWHVRNKAAQPIPTFSPIETPSGAYREPDSGILAEYSARDMTKPGAMQALMERPMREKAKNEKAKALENEQRRDEIKEDLRAGWRVAGDGGLRRRTWGRGR